MNCQLPSFLNPLQLHLEPILKNIIIIVNFIYKKFKKMAAETACGKCIHYNTHGVQKKAPEKKYDLLSLIISY